MGDDKRVPVTIAGIALGACALAGIAYALGWLPPGRAQVPETLAVPAKTAAASTPQGPTTQSGVVLLPGETLVVPPDPVAPSAAALPPAARGPSPPKYTKPAPRTAEPVIAQQSPRPSREERRPSSYERSTRSVCLNCGVVTGITRGDYEWEVRVRFDDGSREALRYYDRPRVQVGDAVHLRDGRLVPE